MEQMRQPYTLGIWNVKPGNEQAFIALWKSLAVWTEEHFSGGGGASLLQDASDRQLFISFGTWKDADTINAWRATAEFLSFAATARMLCEKMEPHSMHLVASSRD